MKTFKDNAGRPWDVEINVAAVKRIRSLTGADLIDTAGVVPRLINDPVLLCDVIYAACKPQADARGVSDEDFGRAMAGDAIEHATEAMLDELVSFSRSPRDRAILGRVIKATNAAMERARDLVETRIDGGELDRAVDRALAEFGSASTTAPESSDATPAP